MRIFLLLTTLTLAFPFISKAQNFDGGFFAGLSMSQIDGDNYWGYNKAGITAGAFILHPITRELDFRMELKFIQKGTFKRSTEKNPEYYRVALQYIEMPLMVQYTYKRDFIFAAGLSPDVLLHFTEEDESGLIPKELHPKFKMFSVGANLDASYALTDNFSMGARFTYSILPVRQHGGGVTYRLNRGWYNNVVSFTGSYRFF